jgi:exo-1,4-beta-D-glucosaminidase
MLNNAWPSTIWHLYDYYLEPAGGYFGTRKANEPVHIQFSYDDRSVVLVNSSTQPLRGLKVVAELYNFDLQKRFSKEEAAEAAADSSQRLFSIPETGEDAGISFVRLLLQDAKRHALSSNFYWLPSKFSTFDWGSSTFEYTPSPYYEDLTDLSQLTPVKLEVAAKTLESGNKPSIQVTLKNPTRNLAFQVSTRVFNKKDGHDILPVLWEDNYFALMPGESRTVTATYDARQLQNMEPEVEVSGWNIVEQTRAVTTTPAKKQP